MFKETEDTLNASNTNRKINMESQAQKKKPHKIVSTIQSRYTESLI